MKEEVYKFIKRENRNRFLDALIYPNSFPIFGILWFGYVLIFLVIIPISIQGYSPECHWNSISGDYTLMEKEAVLPSHCNEYWNNIHMSVFLPLIVFIPFYIFVCHWKEKEWDKIHKYRRTIDDLRRMK